MKTDTLPSTLSLWAGLGWIKQAGATEWHSECPECHDLGHSGNHWPDRFVMRSDGKPRGWCRRCGFFSFADAGEHKRTSVEELQAIVAQQRADEERRRAEAQSALDMLAEKQEWLRWHREMTSDQAKYWVGAGIPHAWQVYYQLGYCPYRVVKADDGYHHTSSHTIPIFDTGRRIANVQHRLLNPPPGVQKYRQEKGIAAAVFFADPEVPLNGKVTIVVEGAKKAAVVNVYYAYERKVSVAGLPGVYVPPTGQGIRRNQHEAFCARLREQGGKVFFLLDPGADETARNLKSQVPGSRIVDLPLKPDDLIVQHGMMPRDLEAYLRFAR